MKTPRETPESDALIDAMLQGDGIPRCKEWETLEQHARTLERDRDRLAEENRRLREALLAAQAKIDRGIGL